MNSKETFLQDQLDVTFRIRTGSLQHVLVAGAEGGRETSSPNRPRFDIQTVPKTSLLSPDTHQVLGGTIASITDTQVAAISSGALIAKKFGRRTLVTADDLRKFIDTLPSAHTRSTAPEGETA